MNRNRSVVFDWLQFADFDSRAEEKADLTREYILQLEIKINRVREDLNRIYQLVEDWVPNSEWGVYGTITSVHKTAQTALKDLYDDE